MKLKLIAALALAVFTLTPNHGWAGEDAELNVPSLEDVDIDPNPPGFFEENVTLYAYAFYDLNQSNDDSVGGGIRLSLNATDRIRVRYDFKLTSFDALDGGEFGELSDLSVATEFDLIEGNSFFPYTVTGINTSLDRVEIEGLIGAGIRWEIDDKWELFVEYQHTEDEDLVFLGVSGFASFVKDAFTGFRN